MHNRQKDRLKENGIRQIEIKIDVKIKTELEVKIETELEDKRQIKICRKIDENKNKMKDTNMDKDIFRIQIQRYADRRIDMETRK